MNDTRQDNSARHALDDYLTALLNADSVTPAPEMPGAAAVVKVAEPETAAVPVGNAPVPSTDPVAESPAAVDDPHAPFDAWVFSVAGLRMAVRAAEIGAVIGTGTALQADTASGCLGSLQYDGRTCLVVDTVAQVLPENRRAACPAPGAYLALNVAGWAIAVDAPPTPLKIDPAAVAWRSDRATRPWLAGMLSAERIAVIDPQYLVMACVD